MAGRDALIRAQYERDAEGATGFAARMRALEKLFAHGWSDDPWSAEALVRELDRAAKSGTVNALQDAGRALLFDERFDELVAWLPKLDTTTPEAREAIAVVRALVHVREGDNESAAQLLHGLPDAEAVALHGLALIQLGQPDEAASRLEILLAADALDEQGELQPRLLPEAMPVLALFLTACVTAADRHLSRGERERAATLALAARDACRRYESAEPSEGPSREEIAALLARVAPQA
ncbi:MAG: hypothetical protein JST54_24200 [Deltaproteobacteria bacterium]|nr:hypothetical protein [Deltaproteobacteria bacterium]